MHNYTSTSIRHTNNESVKPKCALNQDITSNTYIKVCQICKQDQNVAKMLVLIGLKICKSNVFFPFFTRQDMLAQEKMGTTQTFYMPNQHQTSNLPDHESNNYKKDLSWLQFGNKQRFQEKQQE